MGKGRCLMDKAVISRYTAYLSGKKCLFRMRVDHWDAFLKIASFSCILHAFATVYSLNFNLTLLMISAWMTIKSIIVFQWVSSFQWNAESFMCGCPISVVKYVRDEHFHSTFNFIFSFNFFPCLFGAHCWNLCIWVCILINKV